MSLQTWQETLITAQVDGPTLTAAAAATMLPAAVNFTFPNNYFSTIGKMLRIRAAGRISSVITTPGTARFDVRMGSGIVVFDSLAILLDTVAAHVTMPWELEITLTCRAIGTTGNFMGVGKFFSESILGTPATSPKAAAVAMLPWNTAPVVGGNVNTTLANQFDMFFTQTVATGSMTMHQLSVEALN
jgi:hypothetical protein